MSRRYLWLLCAPVVCLLLFANWERSSEFEKVSSAYLSASYAAESAPRDMPAPGDKGLQPQGAPPTIGGLNRKIVYTATVDLVVEDFTNVADRIAALVQKFGAQVADSSLSGSAGENRRGVWRLRVPTARFDEFVEASKGLGELTRASTASQDVSEEYYDVDARIRNKTKEEERLLALLEERPGKLEDVIAIERELSRVREELERMQGRMRVLADQTSLTTIQLSITEVHGYQPPQAPTLATRITRAFAESLSTLQSAAEGLLIATIASLPWLPVLALGFAAAVFGWRFPYRLVRATFRGNTAHS